MRLHARLTARRASYNSFLFAARAVLHVQPVHSGVPRVDLASGRCHHRCPIITVHRRKGRPPKEPPPLCCRFQYLVSLRHDADIIASLDGCAAVLRE